MKTAFVFPGQGSQKVACYKDLYNTYPIVKQRFERSRRSTWLFYY